MCEELARRGTRLFAAQIRHGGRKCMFAVAALANMWWFCVPKLRHFAIHSEYFRRLFSPTQCSLKLFALRPFFATGAKKAQDSFTLSVGSGGIADELDRIQCAQALEMR